MANAAFRAKALSVRAGLRAETVKTDYQSREMLVNVGLPDQWDRRDRRVKPVI